MDKYPSIPSRLPDKYFGKEFYWFPKYDGQNFRAEWNNKKGWYKFGSKNQLVDNTDKYWKKAIELFMDTTGKYLDKYLREKSNKSCIIFCEYWGPTSLAGIHDLEGPMFMTIVDIKIDKKGFIAPCNFYSTIQELVRMTEYFDPNGISYLDGYTEERIKAVKLGALYLDEPDKSLEYVKYTCQPCTFEGVIGKRMEGNQLVMVKLKTDAWREKIRATFGSVAHIYLES
jgi:hypothetical protein